jgi:hypothetical protein
MSFKQYYEHYLTLHQNKWNKRLHALGQLSTLLFVGLVVQEQQWLLLFFTPFIVYPFAWSGHFFFEKNKPAAWSNPLWAKACDWLMLKDMLIRKI